MLMLASFLTLASAGAWPVAELTPPTTLHVARLASIGMPENTSPWTCHNYPSAACDRYFALTTALLSFQGAALRRGSTQGLFVVDQDFYSAKDLQDSVEWLARLRATRPALEVSAEAANATVWSVIGAMAAADPARLARTYVKYDYAREPESLNAARMACSRLNATMMDASLAAEAEANGFVAAAAATVDGVEWTADVSAMNDAAILETWLPKMAPGTLGLEQFVHGRLRPNQADVAAAWPLTSWTPDAKNMSAVSRTRKACLGTLVNGSLVFGLSHTPGDESDLVQAASEASKLLTVSEGSMNVALYASFRTDSPPLQKPFAFPAAEAPAKHYVAFMMHDGDGIDFELGSERPGMLTGFWDRAGRGTVPIGWGVSGQFRDLAQPVVESLYEDAARNGAAGYDDFFMQDGYGYFHPETFSEEARVLDAKRTGEVAAAIGLTTVAFFADIRSETAWETAERDFMPYAEHGNFSAMQFWRQDNGHASQCYVSNNASERGELKWVGDTPIVQLRASLWHTPTSPSPDQCSNTSTVVDLLNAQVVDPTSSRGYSLVHVQGDTPECENLACFAQVQKTLAPHVEIVGPSVLTALIRKNVRKP